MPVILINGLQREVAPTVYEEMALRRNFPEHMFCLQAGEKFYLHEEKPFDFVVYDECGNKAMVTKKRKARRILIRVDPGYVHHNKETGPEGIIPGKSVNGVFVPLDDSRFSPTNPPDRSFLSNLFDSKKREKPSKEAKGYEDLSRILDEALQQATSGKGKERHAGNKPFDKQPIMEIARMTGLAYQTGQAMKKIQESHTLLEIKGKEAAINELRGAIIYLAAAIKTIEEKMGKEHYFG